MVTNQVIICSLVLRYKLPGLGELVKIRVISGLFSEVHLLSIFYITFNATTNYIHTFARKIQENSWYFMIVRHNYAFFS